LLTGILFGLAPAFRASRDSLSVGLKSAEARTGEAREGKRLRSGLVVAEIALATLVVVGGALMLRSLIRLMRVGPGFDPSHVISMQITLPASRYREPVRSVAFYQQLLERMRSTPGIEATSAASFVPMGVAGEQSGDFNYEGEPPNQNDLSIFAVEAFV